MNTEQGPEKPRLRRYSIAERPSKVSVEALGRPCPSDRLQDWLAGLPRLLAAEQLRLLVDRLRVARRRGRIIAWGFGGHVIKVGLGPILVDLMDRGWISALATNGSGVIHDFELAMWGKTSEDVDTALTDGSFGMAEETGRLLNEAFRVGVEAGHGLGAAAGAFLHRADPPHGSVSVLLHAFTRNIPVTVHVAVGTDVIHCHPEASGSVLGEGSFRDFQRFVDVVAGLHDGGVYLNWGSAVILPEVFLKAVTMVRASGRPLEAFTTANFDFLRHYRPEQNVVRRPTAGSGTGLHFTGHHEIMLPLLAALLTNADESEQA
ncbi:MAG: hypothetical protein Kow00109_20010 [Acidobacteriota bacterium]